MHTTLNDLWQQFQAMSVTEIIAALTGLVCMFLMVRNNIWTWLWSIVSVVLYGVVFVWQHLYANAGLQIFYFLPISFYAWWIWLRCGPNKNDDLPVTRMSSGQVVAWSIATVVLCAIFVAIMKTPLWRDDHPYADGITTGMSIVAQYWQARKWIENWMLWIVADVIYTFYLFPVSHMYPSVLLYAITLVLAVIGWREWLKIMRAQETAAA